MRTNVRSQIIAAVSILVVAAVISLGGCGGGSSTAPAASGGSIIGRTIDAATGLGLGNVDVAVVTSAGVRTGTSTTPNGDFIITGIPAAAYTSLTVTPNAVIYGGPRTIAVSIVMPTNGVVTLPGAILILDESPPSPPA